MHKKIPSKIQRLLPWYVNGTLSASERMIVKQYLDKNPGALDDVAAYRQYRLQMKSWEMSQPSSRPYVNALSCIRTNRVQRTTWFHPFAWGAALIVLVLLWAVVRPGVLLEWDGASGDVNVYYIYRTAENGEFQRVGMVPVNENREKFTYIDTMLLPWESYTYVVRGVQGEAVRALSGSVQRDGLAVLPVQMMLVAVSVVLGYGLAGWLRRNPEQIGGMSVLAS